MINKQSLDNAINLMELEFYRVKRYKIDITVAIVESRCKDLFKKVIDDTIRTSDLYQYLDSNSFLIIFDHTNHNNAKIALEKIIKMSKKDCEEKVYIGYSQVKKEDADSYETIQRVLKALDLAKEPSNKETIVLT